jgi:hypothetical protein
MAQTELELDSKQKRDSNANLKIFMARLNSETEFDWQI